VLACVVLLFFLVGGMNVPNKNYSEEELLTPIVSELTRHAEEIRAHFGEGDFSKTRAWLHKLAFYLVRELKRES